MDKPIINYIIGTYFGHRRMEEMNGLELCDLHFKQLTKLKHGINKIYVAVPKKDFKEEIYNIISRYPNLKIEVIFNEDNKGFAFGSWDIALKQTIDEADYSVITEDDYIPLMDNFDQIFLDYFTNDNVAYVCQLLTCESSPSISKGAELCQGIIKHSAFKESGGFQIDGYGYCQVVEGSQGMFLKNIIEHGYEVKDTIDKYRSFYDRTTKIWLYGNKKDPEIFRPIECCKYNCDAYVEKHDVDYIREYTENKELNLLQKNEEI
jgi:hypothetical protein